MEDFVWVFKRPDSDNVAQIPEAPAQVKSEKLWWSIMMLLLQIYARIS